jgi:hypothetical protein
LLQDNSIPLLDLFFSPEPIFPARHPSIPINSDDSFSAHSPIHPLHKPNGREEKQQRNAIMDLHETQQFLLSHLHSLADQFHRLPGSAIFLRYVKSSYQDDPVRSAVELFLFLFAVRYLLAPKYSTKPFVALSEEVSYEAMESCFF